MDAADKQDCRGPRETAASMLRKSSVKERYALSVWALSTVKEN